MQSEVGSVSEKHWYFSEVLLVKGALIKAVFLNVIMQIIQIITALFSMVVYNKVLPNYALSSLYTLVIGVSIVIFLTLPLNG